MYIRHSIRFQVNQTSWKYADALSCGGPASHFPNEPFGDKANNLGDRSIGAGRFWIDDIDQPARSVYQTLAPSHEACSCNIEMTAHPD